MQDLNDMLFFSEVVDRGGFAAAGRALGIPKSRLSRRVADLEARLGVRLLQRTTRRLSLTEVGETYFRHCVAMRQQAQAAEDAVAQIQTQPRGTVHVVCPVTIAQTVVGEVLPQFLARYPEVRVEMEVSNRVVDLVADGVDVAVRVRQKLDDSGSLVIKRLGITRAFLVASPALLEQYGTPQTLADLAALPTVAMSMNDGRLGWTLIDQAGQTYNVQHTPRFVANDLLTLKYAVLAGSGYCALPYYMCREEVCGGQMVKLLPDWHPAEAFVHAVYPSRRGLVPAVRVFLDFLGEHVGDNV